MRRLLTIKYIPKCCGNGCKDCTQIDLNKPVPKPEIKETHIELNKPLSTLEIKEIQVKSKL
jgi:hypothetical protein